MATKLSQRLAETPILLADGATGTNYFEMDLQAGDAPELWNVDAPHKVESLHQRFVDAGADIILANTFGGTANRLKLHNAQNRVHELNKAGAEIARKVADSAKRDVIVAGSVGPTGDLFVPLGELTEDAAIKAFSDQIAGLKAGGADLIWIETMSSREEINAAAKAASAHDMEYVVTASFDTAGKTMMGIAPTELGGISEALNPPPIAYGANCGVGASDLLSSVLDMTSGEKDCCVVAKANCGIPQFEGEKIVYSGTPDLMAKYVDLAINAGARIIGGCCGTSPAHLKFMRDAIDNHQPSSRPNLAEITTKIGPFTNPTAGESAVPRRERRRRRA
ncbi:MAG: betaine--homocysteine S-methyltransferase [Pseudomonadota bacterium]